MLRQVHLARMEAVLQQSDCDYELVPRRGVSKKLDVSMLPDQPDVLQPSVELICDGEVFRIEFEKIPIDSFQPKGGNEATGFSLAKEEPYDPVVIAIFTYRGIHMEKELLSRELAPFVHRLCA